MSEDDLVADLGRLLREGLAMVEADGFEEDPSAAPRFCITARGREILTEPIEVTPLVSETSETSGREA